MKKRILKKSLVISIMLLFMGMAITPSSGFNVVEQFNFSTSDGNIFYVGGSGPNNYTRIQDAIDNASDGDTVYVYDDSSPYYENVVVNKSINLVGEDRDTTIIEGGGAGDVVFVYADYVNISGFTVTNSSELENGIFLNFADYCNISNNIISNNFKGLMLQHSENNTLTDNIVNSNNADGINLLDSSNNNTISNNTANSNGVLDHWGGGIRLGAGGNPSRNVTDNIVTGNTASNNSDDGIGLEWSEENTVIGNIVDSNDAEGISLYHSNYSTVISNTALYNSRSGIGLHNSHNNIISWNNASSNNLHGIYLFSFSSNNIITGNNITSNNDDGIAVEGSTNTIKHNIIDSNKQHGIRLYCSNDNVITNNNISNNPWGIFLRNSSDNNIYYNNIIRNRVKAFFICSHNTWKDNYWNRPRMLPKLIFGIRIIHKWPLPWVNIDWHPAQEPYEILDVFLIR